jgi:hypothetical protein
MLLVAISYAYQYVTLFYMLLSKFASINDGLHNLCPSDNTLSKEIKKAISEKCGRKRNHPEIWFENFGKRDHTEMQ